MQVQALDRAVVSSTIFSSDCNDLLINSRLMNLVQKYLAEIPCFESGPIPANLTGSLGQFIIQIPMSTPSQNVAVDDIGSVSLTSQSPLSYPGSVSYLGGSFLYRID